MSATLRPTNPAARILTEILAQLESYEFDEPLAGIVVRAKAVAKTYEEFRTKHHPNTLDDETIRRIRSAKGSLEKIAKQLGLSKATVHKYRSRNA